MGSINDNTDEVQNPEVGEELAPQLVLQSETLESRTLMWSML